MTARRRFPHALTAAAAAALLACAAAPAGAAQNPTWFDAATISQTVGHPVFAPQVATARGRVVVIWKETAGGRDRLLTSILTLPGTDWSTPEVLADVPHGGVNETPRPMADSDGNINVIWSELDGSVWELKTRTLLASNSDWSDITTLSGDTEGSLLPPEGYSDYSLTARPDGTVVASWVKTGGSDRIRFFTRAANSAEWNPTPDFIDQDGSSPSHLSVQFNASGDGIAVWTALAGSDPFIRFARYDHTQTPGWGPARDAVPIADAGTRARVALSPLGNATVIWDGNGGPLLSASVPAGSSRWTADLDPLTPVGHSSYTATVASDRSGNIVAVYQDYVDGDVYGTSRAMSRVRDRDSWSPAENVMGGDNFGGAIDFAVDSNYNMVATMLTSNDFPHINVGVAYRPDGATSFTDSEILHPVAPDFSSGLPSPALDEAGNPVAVWPQIGDSDVTLGYAIGDANGPALNDLTVPSSGTVGEDLTFSVNPFDRLSGVDATSWSFGEGAGATGSSVTRKFSTAGTYTVTVSASDLSGLVTTATRQITISDPPADEQDTTDEQETTDEQQKVVLAPVIEARLKGKTITLAARVTLRAGKSCSGKASATTSFGTTTYRTTLTLSKVGKACVGTGTIKLRKAPGARSKLRVTVSSKRIRTRTITTKRA